jgi:invasion protein IalB
MTDEMRTWLVRGAIALGIFVAGGLTGWLVHGSASRGDDVAMVSIYKDWRLACPKPSDNKGNCEISQDVLDSKSHSEVAQLTYGTRDSKQLIAVTVPYNVLLEPGMGLQTGSDPVKAYPYETCNGVGCIAMVPADDKLLATFASAPNARILFAGLDEKPVALTFSLDGFNDALKALKSNEAKRRSWWRRLWS